MEKSEKERTELLQKTAFLIESLKKAEAAVMEAQKIAKDSNQAAADEAFTRERMERKYADLKTSSEREEGVLKRSLDFLRKDYEETSRESFQRKKELDRRLKKGIINAKLLTWSRPSGANCPIRIRRFWN